MICYVDQNLFGGKKYATIIKYLTCQSEWLTKIWIMEVKLPARYRGKKSLFCGVNDGIDVFVLKINNKKKK